MKKILILFLLVLTGCSSTYAPYPEGTTIRMFITSDLHYLDQSLYGSRAFIEAQKKSDGKLSIYNNELLFELLEETKSAEPTFLIITGDLTYNGEKASHSSLADYLSKLRKKGIYPLVVPGNHDILNAMAIDYSKEELYYTPYITKDDFIEIYEEAGYKDALSIDPNSLSYLFKASEDLYFLMLDTNTYEKNNNFAPSSEGYLKEETLAWAKENLKDLKDKTILAFMHHPVLDLADMSDYVLKNSDEVLAFFEEYDITLSFSGHIHIQNYKSQGAHTNFGVSSLSVYDHHYLDVTYNTKEIDIKSVNLNMENFSDDPFFENFDENAYDYFKEYSTTRMISSCLENEEDEDFAYYLKELRGAANCLEFAGYGNKIKELYENAEEYQRIKDSKNACAIALRQRADFFKSEARNLKLSVIK